MNMKKISIIALAALTAGTVASMASCGTKEQVVTGVNTMIDVWAPAEEQAVIEKIIQTHNDAQTDDSAKFNIKFTAVSEADGGPTITKDPASAAALVAVADDHLSALVEKNLIWEVGGTVKDEIVNSSSEIAIKAVTNDGKIVGFPISADNGYFLWYNKTKFTAEDVKTLEGLVAATKDADGKFITGKKVLFDLPNGWYANSPFFAKEVCGSESLRFKVEKAEDGASQVKYTVNWDNEKGAAAAAAIEGIVKDEYTAGNWVTGGNEVISAGFTDGSMGAAVSGLWMEKQLEKAIGAENVGAVKLPTYKIGETTAQLGSFAGTKVFTVNKTKSAAEQKAAIYLARLLTNKASQLVRFRERSAIPANLEAQKEVANNLTTGQKAFNEQLAFAGVQSQSAEGKYWDVGKAIGQAMIDGKRVVGENENATWAEFLTAQLNILR